MGSAEVAEIIGCTKEYVQDHGRELGGIFIARKWKWTEASLVQALDQLRTPLAAPPAVAGLAPSSVAAISRRRPGAGAGGGRS